MILCRSHNNLVQFPEEMVYDMTFVNHFVDKKIIFIIEDIVNLPVLVCLEVA